MTLPPIRMTFGVWLAVGLLTLNAGLMVWQAQDPVPYKRVDIISADVENGVFRLTANFTKTGCTFQRLSVVGFSFEGVHHFEWTDDDSDSQTHDREEGTHTLRIRADISGFDIDRIEVRTRHDCDGIKVDKVFMEYSL